MEEKEQFEKIEEDKKQERITHIRKQDPILSALFASYEKLENEIAIINFKLHRNSKERQTERNVIGSTIEKGIVELWREEANHFMIADNMNNVLARRIIEEEFPNVERIRADMDKIAKEMWERYEVIMKSEVNKAVNEKGLNVYEIINQFDLRDRDKPRVREIEIEFKTIFLKTRNLRTARTALLMKYVKKADAGLVFVYRKIINDVYLKLLSKLDDNGDLPIEILQEIIKKRSTLHTEQLDDEIKDTEDTILEELNKDHDEETEDDVSTNDIPDDLVLE